MTLCNSDTLPPVIWWVRRDLRLADNPVLQEICAQGRPVVPVYVLDALDDELGAAAKWRLEQGLTQLARSLVARGAQLVLRRGAPLEQLSDVATQTGATAVYWSRLYDPEAIARDTAVKSGLPGRALTARSFGGRVLFEPWEVATKAGGPFKVYTPFWKAVRTRDAVAIQPPPRRLLPPKNWPVSDTIESWCLSRAMQRGAAALRRYCRVGEESALQKLYAFSDNHLDHYAARRDVPGQPVTSDLSDHIAWGEISPVRLWHVGRRAMTEGCAGAEQFCKEVVWREFATHLVYHTPHILTKPWRPEWSEFPWRGAEALELQAWQRGQTGVPLVDAAMRQLYVTGKMHNRARMVVASFLCKHLMVDWKCGADWFRDCLVDWDPASNAMGWQWVAGSGPDAAPFFRIFNPETQRKTFDGDGVYCRQWLAEGQKTPPQTALDFYAAAPRQWGLSPADMPKSPIVDLAEGRARALAAYQILRNRG